MKRALVVILVLSHCHALTFLCKTKETFKLAELQSLEVKLQAETTAEVYKVSKLLVDQATGSTLFRLDLAHHSSFWDAFPTQEAMPSSLHRCDWIVQVLERETSAEALVRKLQENPPQKVFDQWSIGYIRLEESEIYAKRRKPSYTKNTLLQCISQASPILPALNPNDAKQQLLVVDMAKKDELSCYLTVVVAQGARKSSVKSMLANWSKRPFQYSSAINPQVAEMVMDILIGLANEKNHDNGVQGLTVLDPTCGSGTFLALALERGMGVEGYDCNHQCVQGTRQNLDYLLEQGETNASLANINLCVHDSTYPFPSQYPTIDCVVANLPWGINSRDYLNQNDQILRTIRSGIEAETPCAFVTRNSDLGLFNSTNYEILGQAHVPQRDFVLPKGDKKKNSKELDRNGRNHCVVTIARAI